MSKLVEPGDNVTTIDGRRFVRLPSTQESEQLVHRALRQAAELPDVPERTNPIGVVVAYELYGLSDMQIAVATGFTVEQVEQIRESEVYRGIKDTVIANVQKRAVDEVTAIFSGKTKQAAQTIVRQLDSNMSLVAMSAAQKVLDYAGIGPKHRGNGEQKSLNIVIMDRPK